jgi:benzoyl-CoA reductase/2-hydroxyglutaryl-CoA dehydratase subunit BcrC/BadD/HgdB
VWGRNASHPCQILYLPQNAASPSARTYLRGEYARLRDVIASIAGREVTDERLRASIEIFNDNRLLLRQLYALKRETPWRVAAHEAYMLTAIAGLIPREEHNALLHAVLPLLEQREGRPQDRIRVVFEGGFCEQPPFDLIRAIGRSCYVVDDDLLIGLRWILSDVPLTGDPLDRLAEAYLEGSSYSPVQHDPRKPKEKMLLERVRAADARRRDRGRREDVRARARGAGCLRPRARRGARALLRHRVRGGHDQLRSAGDPARNVHREPAVRRGGGVMSGRTTGSSGAGTETAPGFFREWFDGLTAHAEAGGGAAYVFVMGSLGELLRTFDLPLVFPEINSLQTAVRHQAHEYLNEAEDIGYSPDICGYVKADVATQRRGGLLPMGRIPRPSIAVLTNACNTYIKWAEIWERMYHMPSYVLDIPGTREAGGQTWRGDGGFERDRSYVTAQLRELIGVLEA